MLPPSVGGGEGDHGLHPALRLRRRPARGRDRGDRRRSDGPHHSPSSWPPRSRPASSSPASTPTWASTWSSAASSSWTCRSRRSQRSAPPWPSCCPSPGRTPTGPGSTGASLAFTFIGAAIFSTVRVRHARIPQEAIIGIAYAVASAATILAMSNATSESRAPARTCWSATSWPSPGRRSARRRGLYAVVGVFHYVFRRQFLAISMDHDAGRGRGPLRALLGLPLLRLLRCRGDLVGARSPACCWSSAT